MFVFSVVLFGSVVREQSDCSVQVEIAKFYTKRSSAVRKNNLLFDLNLILFWIVFRSSQGGLGVTLFVVAPILSENFGCS